MTSHWHPKNSHATQPGIQPFYILILTFLLNLPTLPSYWIYNSSPSASLPAFPHIPTIFCSKFLLSMLSPQDYHSSVFYAESLYICHHPLNSKKTAGQDKKGFLNQQCKEIEENNEMGKTRSLQENWRYQGNISCKDGHYKGQKQQGSIRSKRE